MTDAVNMALNHKLQVQISETRAALQRITILENQLSMYGNHLGTCDVFFPKTTNDYLVKNCTCGWLKAKEQSL